MKSNIISVALGEHFKITALLSIRGQIQKFYRDILGCKVIIKQKNDVIKLTNNFYIGVSYEDSVLSEPQMLKSIWMEFRTDNPEELKQKILKFGIMELEYWDKEHFYFQAPGGQVFRFVGTTEAMSKWEQ
jgi:hypothetical protein